MKIYKIVLLVLIVLLLTSCRKTVTSDDIAYDEKEDIFVIKNAENKPFSGTFQHYDDKGLLKYELKVKKGKVDAHDLSLELDLNKIYSKQNAEYNDVKTVLVDPTRLYYKDSNLPLNGKIVFINQKAEGNYKNGLKHGDVIIYNEDGKIEEKAHFKDGLVDGEIYSYRKDGSVRSKINYKDGKEHGEQIYYNKDGSIDAKYNYINGERQ
ncbi:hypothetical protein JEZ13_03255 [bacterium]|nr:hypothetical protein [bacterium]